ncbi:OmpA family protein [Flexithrix dorotheae]|uniref:OmpA family protein n=1 Tax=Flexithrix dorotheae TaxID=70993 RepID=UPI0003615F05|nr:OmpA family protein [Flexithrix dorotheae]
MRGFLPFLFFILFSPFFSLAQGEANTWFFGKNAGISFGANGPEAVTYAALNTEEGCATISDKDGNLLFYTDGVSVWNHHHEILKNGEGLMGNPSSTQSGVILAHPGKKSHYFIFTIAEHGHENGFRYSIADMSANARKGEITEKNIPLVTPVTEKITIVKHRNNKDFWVITHGWKNDYFHAFLINENGIDPNPVNSKTGSIHKGDPNNTQGYLKSSPDGTNLALALETDHIVEVFDFDNESGKVNNPIQLPFENGAYPYGIEFAPNGSLLYVSAAGYGKVYQYDLQAGSREKIVESGILVGGTENEKWIGALQLGVDGKIYFPIYNTPYLGSINQPNQQGGTCQYQNNSIFLESGISQLGLPTFNQSLFNDRITNTEINYFEEDEIKVGKTLIFKHLLFETAQSLIQESSYPELNQLLHYLEANPEIKIQISGHTDNIGNKSFNQELSKNRAEAVAGYLTDRGIQTHRIITRGKGSAVPIRDNNTEEGRKMNRRVEVIFTN